MIFAMFFNRFAIDEDYGGLAFESEGRRCAQLMSDPKTKILIMGNHGLLVIGNSVGDAFDRLYYFERACRTYILALQTGKKLKIIPDKIAEKVACQIEAFSGDDSDHFKEIKLTSDDVFQVPVMGWHQLFNPYKETCHIIEIQYGGHNEEDDIERLRYYEDN